MTRLEHSSRWHELLRLLRESKLVAALMVGVLSSITSSVLVATRALDPAEMQSLDFRFRHTTSLRRADTSVVIAAIDQKSLQVFERQLVSWPWPREFYAILLHYLRQGGAKAVVFDFEFSQRDVDRLNTNARESDSSFADEILKSKNVVLAATLMPPDTVMPEGNKLESRFLLRGNFRKLHAPNFSTAIVPLSEFQTGANEIGAANYGLDVDGVTRRIPLLYSYDGGYLRSLPLAAYCVGTGSSDEKVAAFIRSVPTDYDGNYLINWYGKGGPDGVFKYYSMGAIIISAAQMTQGLMPGIPPSEFKDKYVIVGGSAVGLMDFKPTPFTVYEPYPGMEIHATILSNLLNGDYLRVPSFWLSYLLGIVFALLVALIFFGSAKVIRGTLFIAVFAIVYLWLTFFAFSHSSIWLPLCTPEASIVVAFAFSGVVSYATEGRHRRELKRVLNRYLTPRVVDEILEDPDEFELGGREIEATVFFSDIKNFTGLSEKLTPRELVTCLNEYFTIASDVVLSKDAMLDKYIGDAIMAIFGAPLSFTGHAVNACLAAIEVQNKLDRHYSENIAKNHPVFETRIGLNTGKMVIGNVGSRKRLDYTAIGDSVNLASRLESANKYFGTKIIISESTYELAKDAIDVRELDLLRVKGKETPIRIFELICPKGQLTPDEISGINMFHDALVQYRAKKWRKARSLFEKLADIDKKDGPARAYVERCTSLLKAGVPDDWDGVYIMGSK